MQKQPEQCADGVERTHPMPRLVRMDPAAVTKVLLKGVFLLLHGGGHAAEREQ